MAASSEKAGPSNTHEGRDANLNSNEINAPSSKPISLKRERGEDFKKGKEEKEKVKGNMEDRGEDSKKGKEKKEKVKGNVEVMKKSAPTNMEKSALANLEKSAVKGNLEDMKKSAPANIEKSAPANLEKSARKKVSFQETTNRADCEEKATPNDEKKNSNVKKRKKSKIVEKSEEKGTNEKSKGEGNKKQSSVAGEIEMSNDVTNEIREYVREIGSLYNRDISIPSSYHINTDMLEEPLSNLEMEELKLKWQQQKEVEIKASIGRLELMQEEAQMKMARIRMDLNG